jgi:hypothetical protein
VPNDVRHGFLDDAQDDALRFLIQRAPTPARRELKRDRRSRDGPVCRDLNGSDKLLLVERAWPHIPDDLPSLSARVLREISNAFERCKRIIRRSLNVRERGPQLQGDTRDVLKQRIVNFSG